MIPQWYHSAMAMTLRLSEEDTEALRARAQVEGRSMQEIAVIAVRQYLDDRSARLNSYIERITSEDAELLDRLSR